MDKENKVLLPFIGLLILALVSYIIINKQPLRPQVIFHAHLTQGWYPVEAEELTKKLDSLWESTPESYEYHNPQKPRFIIVPHAGYEYSGSVATAGYKTVEGKHYTKVIILAPSHQTQFFGIALPHFTHYQLPICRLAVDTSSLQKLASNKLYHVDEQTFEREHAIEVQLPFVHKALPECSIIPLIVGDFATEDDLLSCAETLAQIIDKNTLVVISTDLTHYGPHYNYQPFGQDASLFDEIKELDGKALSAIQSTNPYVFFDFLEQTNATICGKNPLLLALTTMQRSPKLLPKDSTIIAYSTSAHAGDTEPPTPTIYKPVNTVSYAALAFYEYPLDVEYAFSLYEQNALHSYAESIFRSLFSVKAEEKPPLLTQKLTQAFGAFVTLEKNNELRGCIGRIKSALPLHQTIKDMTKAATQEDARFSPVTWAESPEIKLKLSILFPPKTIHSTQEIKLGRDGIILMYQGSHAVLLPHVPAEQGWTLQATLEQLCLKAGLETAILNDTKNLKFETFRVVTINNKTQNPHSQETASH